MDHKFLTALAVKWLKRPNSQGGHGCIVAASELLPDEMAEAITKKMEK